MNHDRGSPFGRSIRLRGEDPVGILSTGRGQNSETRDLVYDQEERRTSQARRNIRSRVVEDGAAGATAAAGTVVGFILKGRDTAGTMPPQAAAARAATRNWLRRRRRRRRR